MLRTPVLRSIGPTRRTPNRTRSNGGALGGFLGMLAKLAGASERLEQARPRRSRRS